MRERTERLAQIAQLEKFEQELSKLAPECSSSYFTRGRGLH